MNRIHRPNTVRNLQRNLYCLRNRIRLRMPGAKQNIKQVTLICNTCLGGVILSDLHMRFNSPFVNIWMYPADFVRMLKDLPRYMQESLVFIEDRRDYPVALLGDIRVFFRHYHSPEEAERAWERRKKRMSMGNLFILFSERNGCTYENLKEFDELPYGNKVVITAKEYPGIRSAVCIEGFDNEKASGIGTRYRKGGCRRYIDDFDYVEWFRTGRILKNHFTKFR